MRTCYAFLLLACSVRAAELPKFSDYPEALSRIERYAKATVPDVDAASRCIRDLPYDKPEAPDFADRFTFFVDGCGSGCAEFCLIDRVSGAVFPGVGAVGGPDFEHRRDSRLVIIKHTDGRYADADLFFADCYVWQDGRFRFLGRWQTTNGKAQRASAIDWERVVVFAPNPPTWPER